MIETLEKEPQVLSKTRLDMIEAGGRVCQLLGVPRSTGQIYGLLYLSPKPLSLDDIAEALRISKASASTGTRQLLAWRAIHQVWVHGERRDHFEIEPVAFRDRRPVVHARSAERIYPQNHISALDCIEIDDIRQIAHIGVQIIVSMRRGRAKCPLIRNSLNAHQVCSQ